MEAGCGMTMTATGKRPRDTQKAKCYRAEDEALAKLATPLPTTAEILRYLKKQSTRATLVRRYGVCVDLDHYPLAVSDGRGTRRAKAIGTNRISMPTWARNDWIALHEFAHIVHQRITRFGYVGHPLYGGELRGGAWHGWEFAAIYVELVHFCMGKEAGDALKASFKKHHVRFRPKRTRTLPVGFVAVGKPVIPADQIAMLAVEGRKAA